MLVDPPIRIVLCPPPGLALCVCVLSVCMCTHLYLNTRLPNGHIYRQKSTYV